MSSHYSKLSTYKPNQGFTLVELMVMLTVLTIIITMATPTIQKQLASMEAKRVKSQLENTLTLAKAESYTRRENVLVCLSDTGGHCHRDGNNALLLFIDKNDNNDFDAEIDSLLTQISLNLKYSQLSLRVGNKRHYTKFWGNSGTPRGHFGHIKYCPTVAYNTAMYLISFSQMGIVKQKLNENHPTQCDE
nr:GspH/FimT family pseudopilin [Psychrobacter aquaticus]